MTLHEDQDRSFREETLKILYDLRTKMNFLVGEDGNNGQFGEIAKDVDDLKKDRHQRTGRNNVFSSIYAFGGLVIGAIIQWFLQHK